MVAESNMGDGMFTALLQPVMNKIYPVGIEEVRVSIQKERRIVDTLAPLIQQHRMVVSTDVIKRIMQRLNVIQNQAIKDLCFME